MGVDYKYDIFISYNRNDNVAIAGEPGWVEAFHEDLENWLTKRRGWSELKIWRDNPQHAELMTSSMARLRMLSGNPDCFLPLTPAII